ncbi:uncharacterized protein LOC144708302 [Wolffia australiana]
MAAAGLMRTASGGVRVGGMFTRSSSSSALWGVRVGGGLQRAKSAADLRSFVEGRMKCQARRAEAEVGGAAAPPEARRKLEKMLEEAGGGSAAGCGGLGAGSGGGKPGRGGAGEGKSEMGAYYMEMLEADPGNALLLRNYGRYLHEEGDYEGAEECYGRVILTTPADGEVLSLYGQLVWDAHGDEQRAEAYFERAVEASPEDCYVMGSYAHFLWDAEEAGKDEEDNVAVAPPEVPRVVHAY